MPRGNDAEELLARLPAEMRSLPLLSHSQLQVADRCAYQWYVRYHLGLKVRGGASKKLDTGNFTHQLLADLYRSVSEGMSVQEWLNARLNNVMMEIIDSLSMEDQIQSASHSMRLIQRYCRTDIFMGHTPVGVEQHFVTLVTAPSGRQFLLQGYTDLITIDKRGVIYVWDHKISEHGWSTLRLQMSIQLAAYQVLLRSEGLNVSGIGINRLEGREYKDLDAQPDAKLFRRFTHVHSPAQLQNLWSEFLMMAEHLLDIAEGKAKARRSLRDDCYSCSLFAPCFSALSGDPIQEAVEVYSGHREMFRGLPAGGTVTLDLEGLDA